MSRTRIKICGLTREEDVRAAGELGVDAVGFVCVAASPRYVAPDRLAALGAVVGPFVTPVLLFVDAPATHVEAALRAIPNALLQFHGDESPAYCRSFGRPYLRAVAAAEGVDLLEFERRFAGAVALLADTPPDTPPMPLDMSLDMPPDMPPDPPAQGQANLALPASAGSNVGSPAQPANGGGRPAYGGAGRSFPWQRVPPPERRRIPLILAGGLQADNVAQAMEAVRPYAVDVSSGVEASRGVKSLERMRAFVSAVRTADARIVAIRGGAA